MELVSSRVLFYAKEPRATLKKEINILPRSTHKIRRSYISKLLSEKVDDAFVQGQAGHTDIATTQKYYHYCINSDKENLEKLNKIISF